MNMDLADTFVRQIDLKNGTSLKIHQTSVGDVGCVVWDAALVLSQFLIAASGSGFLELQNSSIVELGGGTGVVGLTAAALGADVLITDLDGLVPLIQKNIDCNAHLIKGRAQSRPLCWGKPAESLVKPDLILVSDCLYYSESLNPLVDTLCHLGDSKTEVLFCYEKRTSEDKLELETKFFQMIRREFTVERIPEEKLDPVYRCPDINMMSFKKKQ